MIPTNMRHLNFSSCNYKSFQFDTAIFNHLKFGRLVQFFIAEVAHFEILAH